MTARHRSGRWVTAAPTSRPPLDPPRMASRSAAGPALGHQPVGGGVEVVEDLLLVGQHAGPVPVLAVLAAAPDAGDGVHAARLAERDQPGGEAGGGGDGEAAVAGEEGGRVGPDLGGGRPHQEHGHVGAVGRRVEDLLDHERARRRGASRAGPTGAGPASGVHRHRPGGRAKEVKVRKARSSWPGRRGGRRRGRRASPARAGRSRPAGVPSRPYWRRRETACSVDATSSEPPVTTNPSITAPVAPTDSGTIVSQCSAWGRSRSAPDHPAPGRAQVGDGVEAAADDLHPRRRLLALHHHRPRARLPVEEDDVGAGRHEVDVQGQPPPVVGDDGHGQGGLVEPVAEERLVGGGVVAHPVPPDRLPVALLAGGDGGRVGQAVVGEGGAVGQPGQRRVADVGDGVGQERCRCRRRRCAGCRARCRPRTRRRPGAGRRATGRTSRWRRRGRRPGRGGRRRPGRGRRGRPRCA